MTSQQKKQWLSQYNKLNIRINQLLEEQKRWYDIATNISPVISDMPRVEGNKDKLGNAVAKITTLSQEIDQQIDLLIKKRNEIANTLNTLNDTILISLMKLRYISCKSWFQISMDMSISESHIYRLHGKALKLLKI